MKIRVTEQEIEKINQFKRQMLMSSKGQLYFIYEYTITEEMWTPVFGKSQMTKFLTDAVVQCYEANGDYKAQLTGRSLELFFEYERFDTMWKAWRMFRKELQSFGFTIVRTPNEESKEECI